MVQLLKSKRLSKIVFSLWQILEDNFSFHDRDKSISKELLVAKTPGQRNVAEVANSEWDIHISKHLVDKDDGPAHKLRWSSLSKKVLSFSQTPIVAAPDYKEHLLIFGHVENRTMQVFSTN